MARPTHPGQPERAPLTAKATTPATSRTTMWTGSSEGIQPKAKLVTVHGSRRTGKKPLTARIAKTKLTARNTQATPPYNTVPSAQGSLSAVGVGVGGPRDPGRRPDRGQRGVTGT